MLNEENKLKLRELEKGERDRRDQIKLAIFFSIALPLAGLIVFMIQNWDDVSEILFWVLVAVGALVLMAGVAWLLVAYGVILNPFSVESRADKLEVRKGKHIYRITRGRPDHELTGSELKRKDRIEAAYNARIARLMDKL